MLHPKQGHTPLSLLPHLFRINYSTKQHPSRPREKRISEQRLKLEASERSRRTGDDLPFELPVFLLLFFILLHATPFSHLANREPGTHFSLPVPTSRLGSSVYLSSFLEEGGGGKSLWQKKLKKGRTVSFPVKGLESGSGRASLDGK